MVVADTHPSTADLEAFALGTLDDAAFAAVETHVAGCPTCQERAAESSDDNLVAVLRRVHVQAARQSDTMAQTQTPGPAPDGAVVAAQDNVCMPHELARHDRYRVTRLLGAGGMGSVFEAEHRVMQRAVAIKVINSTFTSRPSAVERFRREVRAAARLAHPNIVTTYDAEDASNTLFLVMEYVEGISLARLVKEQGPLPVAEACDYIRQAALGLQHAHERGMVHRDVKPDNLVLAASPVESAPGVVKVLDFGLAALTAERDGDPTEANVVMGTPDYMAPEQAAAPSRADIRADVYSLGCTLYYLLTGEVPFPAPTVALKIIAHREQALPDIRMVCPEAQPELAGIMARLLAKKPEDRYQTPGEVASALATFASNEEKKKQGRKHGRLFAVAALLFGLLLSGVIYRVQTDKGELVITTESDDVKVVLMQSGKQIDIIDTKTDKQITLELRSGVYQLELKGAPQGLKLNIDKATLTRGKTILARIERTAKPPQVTHHHILGGASAQVSFTYVQSYDPTKNKWEYDKTPFPMGIDKGDPGRYSSSVGVLDGKLYVTGGWRNFEDSAEKERRAWPTKTLLIYDPAKDRRAGENRDAWSRGPDMKILSGESIAGVIDGKLYVLTAADGYHDWRKAVPDGSPGWMKHFHVYDPGAKEWKILKSPPHAHRNEIGGVIDGKFYVLGGYDDKPYVLAPHIDVYHPATDKWTSKKPMPKSRRGSGSAVVAGKLYVVGGMDESDKVLAGVEVYDPAAESWKSLPSLRTARTSMAVAAIDTTLYAIGGSDGTRVFGTVEALDLSTLSPTGK